MTDTNSSTVGLGIDLRVTGIAGAVSDGQTAELLTGPNEESRSPPELRATDNGVSAREPGFIPEPPRQIPVLPRYSNNRGLSPAEYAGRFELELESLISDVAQGWHESAPAAVEGLGHGSTGEELTTNAVVTVPGVYDSEDRTAVARSIEGAGLDVGAVVRAPLAVAAAEFPAVAEPELFVVIDIGSHWFDAALIQVDPDEETYQVISRVSEGQVGRDAMDKALAEWAIERTAREDNSRVTYEESSIEHLLETAGAALSEIASDAEGSVVDNEVPGVKTEDGLNLGVEAAVNMSDAHEALERIEKSIISRLRSLFEGTDVTRSDVDRVLATGPGIEPTPIANAVSGFLDQPLAEPHLGSREAASPMGAAVIASQLHKNGETPVEAETLDHDIGVLVPDEVGTSFETVVPGSAAVGNTGDVMLKTTQDDQTRGRITIGTRHLGSGDVSVVRSYEVTGIPPASAGEANVSLTVTGRYGGDDGIEVSPLLPSDAATTLSLDSPTESAPDLTITGVDLSEITVSDGDEASLATQAEASADPLTDLSPQSILGRIMSIRYNLWHTSQADATLEPGDVENLLKEFTGAMRRLDVEPIEPSIGDTKDLTEHTVWKTRPSEEPDNTILEVRKPGYRIGEHVEETADVIISKGEPESTDDEVTDDDEVADDDEAIDDDEAAEVSESSEDEVMPESGEESGSDESSLNQDSTEDRPAWDQ